MGIAAVGARELVEFLEDGCDGHLGAWELAGVSMPDHEVAALRKLVCARRLRSAKRPGNSGDFPGRSGAGWSNFESSNLWGSFGRKVAHQFVRSLEGESGCC